MIGSSVKWKGQWNGLLGKWTDSTDYPLNPNGAPGLQARYNIADLSSLIYDGSNRVQLVGDVSGNSNVNALCMNATLNVAVLTTGFAAGTGQFTVSAKVMVPTTLPGSNTGLCIYLGSSNVGGAAADAFYLIYDTNGDLQIVKRSAANGFQSVGTVAGFNAFAGQQKIVTVRRNASNWTFFVDGASVGTSAATFAENVDTTYLCSSVSGALGDRTIFWQRLYNTGLSDAAVLADAQGTVQTGIVANMDFSIAAKLAPSFVCSTGQTVTINTSGATGARISGARDLVQMTVAKQPVLTIAAGGNYLTFDGSDDYMKAASFPLVQPETVYSVISKITSVNNASIHDGGANATLRFSNGSTSIRDYITSDNSNFIINPAMPTTGVLFVATGVYNGASSLIRANRLTATTGNAGTVASNGFTLGAEADGAPAANITFSEALLYSTAQNAPIQNALITGLMARWGISS